jgi:hypothetical protein
MKINFDEYTKILKEVSNKSNLLLVNKDIQNNKCTNCDELIEKIHYLFRGEYPKNKTRIINNKQYVLNVVIILSCAYKFYNKNVYPIYYLIQYLVPQNLSFEQQLNIFVDKSMFSSIYKSLDSDFKDILDVLNNCK